MVGVEPELQKDYRRYNVCVRPKVYLARNYREQPTNFVGYDTKFACVRTFLTNMHCITETTMTMVFFFKPSET